MQINDKGNVIRSSPKLKENVWYRLEVEQLIEGNQASFVKLVKNYNITNYAYMF